MLRKTTLLYLLLLSGATSFCSTVQPFYDQDFSNGMPAGWNTGDDSGQNVGWEYCAAPDLCPPHTFVFLECSRKQFKSPSTNDGYMFVNSFKHGLLSSPHESYLRTGVIDCSQKMKVFIRFSTYIAGLTSNPDTGAVLRVRNSLGQWHTLTIFPFLNNAVAQQNYSWNPQEVLLDISGIAANQAQVQIEWRWTGNFGASWQLDDVELFGENPLLNNAVWGTAAGQGDFNGGLNGWTVPPPPPGFDDCQWEWSAKPLIDFPDSDSLANVIGCSPSYSNGAATMNATFCSLLFQPTPFSQSELRSPAIDLSGIPAGTRLALRFYQAVAAGNTAVDDLPVTSVLVSTDGGLSFIDTLNANPALPFSKGYCGLTTLNLPPEVAGNSQVKLYFVFSGDTYYWLIDDVMIVRNHDFDLQVNPLFYAVSPNFAIPASQVRPIGFFADFENIGQQTLNLVTAFATVVNQSTNSVVFRDTLHLGTMMPGDVAGNIAFGKTYTPPPAPARYTCVYEVASDETDGDFSNNKVRWEFEVTDTTFAKTPGLCEVNGYFAPNDDIVYETGTCFFVPKGSQVAASSISFAYTNAGKLANANGEAVLQTALYRWKTDSTYADANVDTIANFNEYELIAINEHKVKISDNKQVINVPIDFENPLIPLEDSSYYFATVGYLQPVTMAGQEVPFYIAGSEEIDYTSAFWLSYQMGVPTYVSMLRLNGDDFFRANAWALRRIPFVQLHVQQLTGLAEKIPEPIPMEVFPNPANGLVYIKTNFEERQEPASVEIFDICGRLVKTLQVQHAFVSQLPIDVSFLSNGSYTLRVRSNNRSGIAKLVILK